MATRMQQRRGTAAQWISTNSGNGPILNAGEIGYETDTNKFKIGDGTNHWINLDYFVDANSTVNPAFGSSITFEGATANDFETTLAITDPTADRTITFPDATGTVALTSDISELSQDAVDAALTAGTGITKTYNDGANTLTIAVDTTAIQARVADVSDTEIGYLNGVTSAIQTQMDTKLASATASTTYAPLAAPALTGNATAVNLTISGDLTVNGTTTTVNSNAINVNNQIIFEGATANDFETTLTVVDPTADRTVTFQNATGTVVLRDSTDTLTNKSISLGSNTVTSTLAQLNTAVSDADVASLAGTETLTNKTLTSPVINTPTGITKSDVGLANVDNTTDALKPVSTATQTALDLKAPLNSPTFTGTVTLPANTISQSMMGDDSVGTNEIGGLAVTTEKIAALAVTEGKIADGAVTSTKIANNTIVNADINSAAAIAQSKIADLTTDLAAKAPTASPTFTGAVTLAQAPTSDLHAATKLYVDNVTAGINFHESVHAASVNNLAANYANGTSGVGATLTADTNRAFSTLDGESITVGQRVLIKNQTDQKQNGIYTLTTNGSVSAPWVLTRATDSDNNPLGEMKTGDFCFSMNGTVNASVGFINNSTANPIVIGTDNITYTEFNAAKTVAAGAGLTEGTPGVLSVATGGITTAMIADGAIVDVDINASAAIAQSKISGLVSDLAAKAPLASPTFTGTVTIPTGAVLGTPTSATLTNATGLPVSGITSSTSSALGLGTIELGHATDTTISRVSAGRAAIEGVNIVTTASTDTLTNKTLSAGILTGTLTAGGGVGTSGQLLSSTSTGVQWVNAPTGYSAPTLGSTSITSGATVTTISGLTDVVLNGAGSVQDELTLLLMGAL